MSAALERMRAAHAALMAARARAETHGPVEVGEHGHEFRKVLQPMVLHRSVSPEEWEAIQAAGSITGGLNKFNPWDKRREVFFGDEPTENLLHQGGEASRRAEYAIMNSKHQAELDAVLKRIRQIDDDFVELAQELGFESVREVRNGIRLTNADWKRLDKKRRTQVERETAIRDAAREAIFAKMRAIKAQDEARGYNAVLLTTNPLAGARMYQGKDSGMGAEAEYGMESGAVKLSDIAQVRFIKDLKLIDAPAPKRLLDSVGGLARAKVASALVVKVAQYKAGGLSALERLKLAAAIRALLAELGGSAEAETGEPAEVKALRAIARGADDGKSLAELYGLMQEAINALQEAGAMSDDAEVVAHEAITHWAEMEQENAGS